MAARNFRISESPELEDDWRSIPPCCQFPFAPVPPGVEPHQSVPFELAPASRSPSPSFDAQVEQNLAEVKAYEERNPHLIGFCRQDPADPRPMQVHVNRMKRGIKGYYTAENPDPEGRNAKSRKKEWTAEELEIPANEAEAEEWAEAARAKAKAVDDSGVQEAEVKSSQDKPKSSQSQGKRSMLGPLGFTVTKPAQKIKKGSDSPSVPKLVYFDSTEEETDEPIASTSRSPDPSASQSQATSAPAPRKNLLSAIDAESLDSRPNLSRGISGFETFSQFDMIGNMAAIQGDLREDLADVDVLDSQYAGSKVDEVREQVPSDVDELEDDEMVDQLAGGESEGDQMRVDEFTAL